MGISRGIRVVVAVVALAGALVGVAQAAGGSSSSKYYVVFKVKGSYGYNFACPKACSESVFAHAHWTYRERFGPFSIQKTTKHVKARPATFGGGWSYKSETSSPSTTCSSSGKWLALNFLPAMSSKLAHGKLRLMLTGGPDPMGNYDPSSCETVPFFGNCGAYMGSTMAKTSAFNCEKPEYFITHLKVSSAALKRHKYVYAISSSQAGSEKVNRGCNQGTPSQGASYVCTYKWSGTVTFKPAG